MDQAAGHAGAARIRWNSLWLFAARSGGQLLSFLFTLVVARGMGQAVLGQYAFIAGVLLTANIVTTFGMDTVLLRETAADRDRASHALVPAIGLQLVLSTAMAALVAGTVGLLPNQSPQSASAMRIAALSLFPMAFSTGFSAVLRAHERMGLYAIFALATAVVQLLGAVIVIAGGGGIIGLAWATCAAQTAGAVIAGGLFLRVPSNRIELEAWPVVRRLFSIGWPLALLMSFSVIYQRLPIFSLSLLSGDEKTGWFSAAARLNEAARMLPYAFYGAIFPGMARARYKFQATVHFDTDAVEPLSRVNDVIGLKSFRVLVLGSLAACLAVSLLANPLVMLLFGPAYVPSASVLRVLIWSLPPFVLSLALSVRLVSSGGEKRAVAVLIPTLLIAYAFLRVGIAGAGIDGAAWAVVGSETVHAAALMTVSRL